MCSATRLFTFFAVVVGFFAVIFTVDIFKPYRQNIIDVIPGYVKDTFTNYYDAKRLTKVFTQEELGNYKGVDGSPVYLAVLGQVFDVTKGRKHYGPGGGYEFFAGKDGTRGYVTGEFNEKGLIDDISGFSLSQIHSVEHWVQFYKKQYSFKGYLIGKFFDKDGNPTQVKRDYDSQLIEANKEQEDKEADIRRFPPCNSQFKAGHGKKLWCSNYSGGIQRDWVGVPRKYFRPGSPTPRCACVKNIGAPSHNPGVKNHKDNGDLDNPNIKLYEGCGPNADSCSFSEE